MMIQVPEQDILLKDNPFHLFPECIHVFQLTDLDTDFCKFVTVKRSNSGFRRPE